jgi:hypothetical protein
MHGLGPHSITVNGRKSTVRQELKETYSALEEAKADISGPVRDPAHDRQGRDAQEPGGVALHDLSRVCVPIDPLRRQRGAWQGDRDSAELLLDQRGFLINGDGTFVVNKDRIKEGVAGLTRDIMTIQAEGNYAAAKALGEKMGVVRPEIQKALDKLQSIPVDIEPRFVTADELLKRR